jgi:hypothetical protein
MLIIVNKYPAHGPVPKPPFPPFSPTPPGMPPPQKNPSPPRHSSSKVVGTTIETGTIFTKAPDHARES